MLARFLSYIEIKTKITSLFAFLVTIAYLFYKKLPVNWELTGVFFAAMFIFDLTTTAINNYIDTKTNEQVLQFSRKSAFAIIVVLFFISAGLGIYLAIQTDLVVLFVGMLCFLCGVLYTGGPVPISRQPWGEILSGIFYGLLIPFLLLYINSPEGSYITFQIGNETIGVSFQIWPFVTLILFSVAPVCTTANIMLANNTCDVEKDVLSKRYTLPYYIGKYALYLFAMLYYMIYIANILMVTMKMLHPIVLLSLLTIFPVQKNINVFFQEQIKEKTFIVSIKNYVIIMATQTLLIFISGFLG